MWIAEYEDGTLFKEFDDGENSFYDIETDRLKKFYVEEHFYDIETGTFNIAGNTFAVGYKIDETLHKITGRDDTKYDDVIQFKDAFTEFDPKKGVSKSQITAYNFGYKGNTDLADFEIIATIKNDNFVTVKLSADKEIDGELVLFINGEPKFYKAPLSQKEGNLTYKF